MQANMTGDISFSWAERPFNVPHRAFKLHSSCWLMRYRDHDNNRDRMCNIFNT